MPRLTLLVAVLALAGCGKPDEPTGQPERPRPVEPPTTSPPPGREPAAAPTGAKPHPASPPEPMPEPVAVLKPLELFEEYGRNPLAADARYKGKWVEVVGDDWVIEPAEGGGYALGFRVISPAPGTAAQLAGLSARERRWFAAGAYPPNVTCSLSPRGRTDFASARPGDPVRVVGKVDGVARADVWKDYVVRMTDGRRPAPKP